MSDYSPSISFSLADGFIYVDYDAKKWRIAAYEISSFCAQAVEHLVKDFPSATDAEKKSLREKCVEFFNSHYEEIKKAQPKPKIENLKEENQKDTKDKEVAWKIAQSILTSGTFLSVRDDHGTETFRYDPNEGIYKRDSEPFVANWIESNTDEKEKALITKHVVNEVFGHIERNNLEDRSIFEENNPHLVLEDCLYNLETKQKEKFRPDYHSLNKYHVRLDESVDYHSCEFWRVLNELSDPEQIGLLQEILGAIFRRKYLTKKLAILEGPTDTGKTTVVNSIFVNLLGAENVASIPFQRFVEEDRFSQGGLFGKDANIVDDMPRDVIKSVGKLKAITGDSIVDGERKYHDLFHFRNHAFMIAACNKLAEVKEDDDAWWNRIELILFTKQIPHEKQDKTLSEKLQDARELSGILNWGLEGYRRLEAQGWKFSRTRTIEEKKLYYKRHSEPVWAFVQDCIEESSDSFVVKKECYERFKKWAAETHENSMTQDLFFKKLPTYTTVRDEYHKGQDGRQQRCFGGIKFKELGQKDGKLGETFVHLRPDELGFGSDCEYCGRNSVATYKSSEGGFACKECATSS